MNKVTIVAAAHSDFATEESNRSRLYTATAAAGFGVPGDDSVEFELNIHDYLVTHPESTFFVRVSGDSMEGAGIFSGDILVVDRSIQAKKGAVVVAAAYGELVVKRLGSVSGQLALLSENEGYEPILISETGDCYVWGVVTGSVRSF